MATARPASDISAGTWLSTGATLHGVLSETTPNDADYIYTSTPGVAVVGLDEVTDPGVYTGFSLPYRAASDDGTKALRVALREGTTLIAEETRYNVPAVETDYALTPSASAMEAVTNWSDLRLEFEYIEVGEGALDEDLIAPEISLVSAQDEFPPVLAANFDVSTLATDGVQLEVATDGAFSTIVLDQTVTVGEGDQSFPGLSALTSEVQRWFRERIIRGASYGPWSNVVTHGDLIAPTITSSASPSVDENTVNPTGMLTADETVTWSKTGLGADQTLFSVDATTGEWTLLATPDFETKASYQVEWRATDLAGNTATQMMTLAINDVAEAGPTIWGDKSSFITLSNGDMTATGTAGVGAPQPVRTTTAKGSGKWYAEISVNASTAFTSSIVGLVNTLPANFADPGGNANGIAHYRNGNVRHNGSTLANVLSSEGLDPFIARIALDADNDKVWFGVNGTWDGDPAAGTGGYTADLGSFALLFAAHQDDAGTLQVETANLSYSPPSGFSVWGD